MSVIIIYLFTSKQEIFVKYIKESIYKIKNKNTISKTQVYCVRTGKIRKYNYKLRSTR